MKQFKPILKPISQHLGETRDAGDELAEIAGLLELAARKLRRIAGSISPIDVQATKRKFDQQFS